MAGGYPWRPEKTFGIVTPAFHAEPHIVACVQSVREQTYPHWEQWIVADDGVDYAALLAEAGIRDSRLHFLSTRAVGAGSSWARNEALSSLDTDYGALLDADDRFKPDKLQQVRPALDYFSIVSTAIEAVEPSGRTLRLVGDGPDKVLAPANYKWTNLSMDSMICWHRGRTDGRCDLLLRAMTDFDFLLKLMATASSVWHIGTPLHEYLKLPVSISNGPGVAQRMISSKREIWRQLDEGAYPMADPKGPAGMMAFLDISLRAEKTYEAAAAAKPGLLFEDHIAPMLRAAGEPGAGKG
jgi:glycosyltransferase involved in cell wall biosynthesis